MRIETPMKGRENVGKPDESELWLVKCVASLCSNFALECRRGIAARIPNSSIRLSFQ